MIVLRLRAKQRMFFGSSASVGEMKFSVKANSFLSSGVLGPQLSLAFNLAPPQPYTRGHGPRALPEPADLQIEVLVPALHHDIEANVTDDTSHPQHRFPVCCISLSEVHGGCCLF